MGNHCYQLEIFQLYFCECVTILSEMQKWNEMVCNEKEELTKKNIAKT